MKVTYFIEIFSSWCHWAEPAWAEVRQRYAGRVEFDWRIALMNPADFPDSREQCDWYYRRSGAVVRSPYMLNAGWVRTDRGRDYTAPNLVAEAGRDFDSNNDRLRLALAHAALREGQPLADMAIAAGIGARVIGVSAAELRARAESDEVRARVGVSTQCFHDHRISQRPSFILESGIGDKVVISGLWVAAPLCAAIEAMLSDAAAYATHHAHFGAAPAG